ncbi:MAG: site-specific integrase [Candidatus Lindowbacteria bacterium]|nr:site-specific integrase [Candidatus Lindowbacteria bacterium]
MGHLRRRMEEELILRGYSEKTVKVYLMGVRHFAKFHGTSPEKLGTEEIRQFLLHLAEERKLSWSSVNTALCSLKFFYTKVLDREWEIVKITYQKKRKKLPLVLSGSEVERIIDSASRIRDKTILMTMYAG